LYVALAPECGYPPSGSKEIEDALRALGKPVEFHVIEAPYGHDCFLLEEARQTPIIRQFLSKQSGGGREARGREKQGLAEGGASGGRREIGVGRRGRGLRDGQAP